MPGIVLNQGVSSVTASQNDELDEILREIVASLQLTGEQYTKAETSYSAVGEWLQDEASRVRSIYSSIFPQGSLRLDTTVRPLSHTEFDLDLVCQLDWPNASPMQVYDLILARMREHGRYDPLLVENRRCIRIEYAGNYHLDIVPAIADPDCDPDITCMLIPDREKKVWIPSNPKGYSEWFESRTVILQEGLTVMAQRDIEPLKVPAPHDQKAILRLTVQLLKRWRDVAFKDRTELQPSSIVLTTLCGKLYSGEPDPATALMGILEGVCSWAKREPIRFQNPSNPNEWITNRWDDAPDAYEAFVDAMNNLCVQWYEIVSHGRGPKLIQALKQLFDEVPVKAAMTKIAERVTAARETRQVFTDTATRGISVGAPAILPARTVANPPHQFHGLGE